MNTKAIVMAILIASDDIETAVKRTRPLPVTQRLQAASRCADKILELAKGKDDE